MTPHPAKRIRKKYRPSIRTILFAVHIAVLLVPLASLAVLRLYDNQLVRETEAELIVQAALLKSTYEKALMRAKPDYAAYGVKLEEPITPPQSERFQPISSRLDMFGASVFPPRPDGVPAGYTVGPDLLAAAGEVYELFKDAQPTTLAGFRLLDAQGTVISGREELGLSLAQADEVKQALLGHYASVLRLRASEHIARATDPIGGVNGMRLFVAFPIIHENHLWGVIYLSRTPDNAFRQMYEARQKLGAAAAVCLLIAVALAWGTARSILRPVAALAEQARTLARGNKEALTPLAHYGTRELAALGAAFLEMAEAIEARSHYIGNFAMHVSHEFKTPLTSIRGYAELLLDHFVTMNADKRSHFLKNIMADTDRLRNLVTRLVEVARADSLTTLDDTVDVDEAIERLASQYAAEGFVIGFPIIKQGLESLAAPLSEENFKIIATNLIQNAAENGASQMIIDLKIEDGKALILFKDNGHGVSDGNRDKIFQPFFTTRRAEGGTGLGLRIVQSLVEAHGGTIALEPSQPEYGAVFALRFPFVHERDGEVFD